MPDEHDRGSTAKRKSDRRSTCTGGGLAQMDRSRQAHALVGREEQVLQHVLGLQVVACLALALHERGELSVVGEPPADRPWVHDHASGRFDLRHVKPEVACCAALFR